MTETAGQLLGHAVPVCQWIPSTSSNPTSTAPAFPQFPNNVRKWTGFFRAVKLGVQQHNLPAGQFPIFGTSAQPLKVEDDAKMRLYINALFPVEVLLPQGLFGATSAEFSGASDFVLCTNNYAVAKMPVVMKTRHNLDLRGYNFWDIYRYKDRRGIMDSNFRYQRRKFDPDFKFKKRILLQIFGAMACNGLHYGILSNYSDTYFLKREETTPTTLYVYRVVQPTDINPTLRECVYYISQLAMNDNVGNRLGRDEIFLSNDENEDYNDSIYHDSDDHDDPDCNPDDSDGDGDDYVGLRKRKRKSKSSSEITTSSSKRIITIGDYIGGGSFGKVFSGCYDNHDVAWKICDGYKQQKEKKTLKHEAHIYSILKECQGRDIPHLFYKGYIYGGYLFALALQLIEDSHHIDPSKLTKKEKKLIVNQLKSIHNYGVLHNDIAERNILYEPKSRHYFFIDFGLSEIVDNESPELRKEEKRLKRLLKL
ncbi:hypothetical protein C2G38_2243658 [Gigaspora rosea]|uniref:Protein kinase domain-containing protein n=1 Tax=Gigaspora rosea TaxID=44941 RepID=A0A397VIQ8_9GLOM|nr:hypothetical protein C2G38_2243658 [Gigaspora rosea]CAG8595422.1 16905_t:CDS:2 [Gigaspora rosea]